MSLKRGLDCAETKSCDVSFDGPQSYFPFFPLSFALDLFKEIPFCEELYFQRQW